MIELEKTYLAKYLPSGLKDCRFKEIIDIYVPENEHPKLRVRKNGDKYEITKKEPVKDGDASKQTEQTIVITKEEFDYLNKSLKGKRTHKLRYYYDYKGRRGEVDVFQGGLKGLVVVDFEFDDESGKDNFEMPEFCLVEVTQEVFLAGGMLCGKSYSDIEKELEKVGYKKLFLE